MYVLFNYSLVPRPHPDCLAAVEKNRDFFPRLRDKIWEGPGDDATSTKQSHSLLAQSLSPQPIVPIDAELIAQSLYYTLTWMTMNLSIHHTSLPSPPPSFLSSPSHQKQQVRSMDTEVDNFKKNITKEQERNEQLTLMLNKVTSCSVDKLFLPQLCISCQKYSMWSSLDTWHKCFPSLRYQQQFTLNF